MSHTVELHRVLKSTPDRVYRAFTTPAALAKWLPPHGLVGTVHEMDARVGGRYRMSFTNFTTGASHAFGGEYLELVPGERLRYTDAFEDPKLPGRMETMVSLRQVLGEALSAYGGVDQARIAAAGPEITLSPESALAMHITSGSPPCAHSWANSLPVRPMPHWTSS